MKKTLSILLAMIMIIGILPLSAISFAAEVEPDIYEIDATGVPKTAIPELNNQEIIDYCNDGDYTVLFTSEYDKLHDEYAYYLFYAKDSSYKFINVAYINPDNFPKGEIDWFHTELMYIDGKYYLAFDVVNTDEKLFGLITDTSSETYYIATSDFESFEIVNVLPGPEAINQDLDSAYMYEGKVADKYIFSKAEFSEEYEGFVYYYTEDLVNFTKINMPKLQGAKIIKSEDEIAHSYVNVLVSEDGILVYEQFVPTILGYFTQTSYPQIYFSRDLVNFEPVDVTAFGPAMYNQKAGLGMYSEGSLADDNKSIIFDIVKFTSEYASKGETFEPGSDEPKVVDVYEFTSYQHNIFAFDSASLSFKEVASYDFSCESIATNIDAEKQIVLGKDMQGRAKIGYKGNEYITGSVSLYDANWNYNYSDGKLNYVYGVTYNNQLIFSADEFETIYQFKLPAKESESWHSLTDGKNGKFVLARNTWDTKTVVDEDGEKYVEDVISATKYYIFDINKIVKYAESLQNKCAAAGKCTPSGTIKNGKLTGTWITDTEADAAHGGKQHTYCTVCGKRLESAEIDRLAPAPVELGKISNVATGIKIEWEKTYGAESYNIYRKLPSDDSWEKIANTTKLSYIDKSVSNGKTYKYAVRARNSAGLGAYDHATLSILCLRAPALKAINSGADFVKIEWGKVKGAQGYIIYRKANSETKWTNIAKVTGADTLTYKDKTVENKGTYTYTVRAYSTKPTVYGGYNGTGISITFLTSPKLVGATADADGIIVKYDAVDGANGYVIYRKENKDGSSWARLGTVAGDKLSYIDLTAKVGKNYLYTVRAYYGSDSKSNLSAYDKKGVGILCIAAPELKSAANVVGGVKLKWAKAAQAKGYNIYRQTEGETEWVAVGTVKGASTLTFTDKSTKNNTKYTYVVEAYNGKSKSGRSNEISLLRLVAPKLLSAENIEAGKIEIKFSSIKGTKRYAIYRKVGSGKWEQIGLISGVNNTTFVDKNAAKGTTYTYTVRAVRYDDISSFRAGISCKSAK